MLGKAELLQLLDEHNIPYACEEHDPVLNMAESGKLTLSLHGARCKNLLLQDKQGRLFLVMTTPAKSLDLTSAARAFGSKRLSFASADVLLEVLGLRPGSLSPFALVNDKGRNVRLIVDAELAGEDMFLLHPLVNSATVAISRPALERFLAAIGYPLEWVALEARPATGPGVAAA